MSKDKIEYPLYTLNIKGIEWTVKGVSREHYIEAAKAYPFSEHSNGICFLVERHILINIQNPAMKGTIIHELSHAYIDSCCAGSVNFTTLGFEELVCGILGDHLDDLVDQSKAMFKVLNADRKRLKLKAQR